MTQDEKNARNLKVGHMVAMDSKPISGRNGSFKSSVPAGAVRPKPVAVPDKKK
jgi:hypothetical protein